MRGKIKYIVFDFDGTIADTIDLALSIYARIAPEYDCLPIGEAARKKLGRRRLQDLLKEYGISKLKLVMLVLRIRKEIGIRISELKPVKGIRDSLQEIKGMGFRLGILTTNSKGNVKMFLENNDLSDKIDFIYSGKSLFGKDKVMTRLFDQEGISREELIYVGDEIRDMEASVKAGIQAIAVSWGLCSWENQDSLRPDQVAHTPNDLVTCIKEIINDKNLP